MQGVGQLHVQIMHDRHAITQVHIHSRRPQAAHLLQGKTVAQVEQLVPLLFSLCGKAQTAAAQAALLAAKGLPAQTSHLPVVKEAIQEHLWRLLLDWPKLLGLPQQKTHFLHWHQQLRDSHDDVATHNTLRQLQVEIETHWLGMDSEAWLGMLSLSENWLTSAHPAAQLIAGLQSNAVKAQKNFPLLPAHEMLMGVTAEMNNAFAATPSWQHQAAETGALSYYASHALLQSVMGASQSATCILARVLARMIDMLTMLLNPNKPRVAALAKGDNVGVATVQTARGMLLHHVSLAQGTVTRYVLVAPTEWNFHPQGALVAALKGLKGGQKLLQHQVEQHILSLDPCVAYELSWQHA